MGFCALDVAVKSIVEVVEAVDVCGALQRVPIGSAVRADRDERRRSRASPGPGAGPGAEWRDRHTGDQGCADFGAQSSMTGASTACRARSFRAFSHCGEFVV